MPNRLIHETSPYLLQHAHNPVDWHPWDEEALSKAQQEDKPIFLSIGYAACHWCHVMEHESFEDTRIAQMLNEHFVSIKVDREERPDLDSIYMAAVVTMTGHGGWPMSVFLTPDLQPFYGGTYFPPERRYGMPAFTDVLEGIIQTWKSNRQEVFTLSQKLTQYLKDNARWDASTSNPLSPQTLQQAIEALIQSYDWQHGGWGAAPKFPAPMTIEFLLQQGMRGNSQALQVATHALKAMNRGGIYDVVGGGFHRYSTDNRWLVPHFEKMLYDNAQLALAYLHAYLATNNARLRQTCEETLDFILKEMSHPEGGFYSSLDADSEGEEGKFYLWTPEEIQQALPDPLDQTLFLTAYNVTVSGNFEGRTVLQHQVEDDQLARDAGLSISEVQQRLPKARERLYHFRARRQPPATDDKVLVFWNALTLQALAEATRYLNRRDYLAAAQKNARFLLTALHPQDRLLRSWRGGKAKHNAYLEDYAALILALLALYQTDLDPAWYQQATALAEEMLAGFQDSSGGFYDTRHDQSGLLVRPKELQDNATPSGNALTAMALLWLAAYSDNRRWQTQAEKLLSAVQGALIRYPTAFSFWLQALDFAIGPVRQIALVWPEDRADYRPHLNEIWKTYRPRTVLAGSAWPAPPSAPPLLENRPPVDHSVTVYICRGFVCNQPAGTLNDLKEQLDSFENDGLYISKSS